MPLILLLFFFFGTAHGLLKWFRHLDFVVPNLELSPVYGIYPQ